MKISLGKKIQKALKRLFRNCEREDDVIDHDSRTPLQTAFEKTLRTESQSTLCQWLIKYKGQTTLEQWLTRRNKEGDFYVV